MSEVTREEQLEIERLGQPLIKELIEIDATMAFDVLAWLVATFTMNIRSVEGESTTMMIQRLCDQAKENVRGPDGGNRLH